MDADTIEAAYEAEREESEILRARLNHARLERDAARAELVKISEKLEESERELERARDLLAKWKRLAPFGR